MGDLRAHCFVEGFSCDSKPDKTLRALKTEWQLVCYYEMESLATQTSLHSDPSHSSLLFTLAFNVYVSILLPVSAPPTSLDECLFSISLVSVPLAVRFSVSSGCVRRCSVSTYAAILVLVFFFLIYGNVYYFAKVAITKFHRLGGLNKRKLFLTVLEAGCPRSRCQEDCFPLRPLPLARRCLPSLCVSTSPSLCPSFLFLQGHRSS